MMTEWFCRRQRQPHGKPRKNEFHCLSHVHFAWLWFDEYDFQLLCHHVISIDRQIFLLILCSCSSQFSQMKRNYCICERPNATMCNNVFLASSILWFIDDMRSKCHADQTENRWWQWQSSLRLNWPRRMNAGLYFLLFSFCFSFIGTHP